jgi:hypothetical protein
VRITAAFKKYIVLYQGGGKAKCGTFSPTNNAAKEKLDSPILGLKDKKGRRHLSK